jgi:hypothetical protein
LNGVSVSRGSDRLLQEFEIADRCNVDMLLHAAMRPDIAADGRKRICSTGTWRRVVATSTNTRNLPSVEGRGIHFEASYARIIRINV